MAVKALWKVQWDYLPSIISKLEHRKSVESPHMVQILENFDTPDNVFVEREHVARGQLLQHIPEAVDLQEEEACKVFRQVASTMGYCHT